MPASRAEALPDGRAGQLRAAARAWLADDPDPGDRAELEALLRSGDLGALAERFASPLTFGTAGIRGVIGAGPSRMNRATVRRVTAGLAGYLKATEPDAGPEAGPVAGRGPVVIGFDARRRSAEFAGEAAAVLTGAGLRALRLPGPVPTPVLAFAVRHLGAAAGVMVTASHNPRDDNGYKVYWADGAQIIAPVDAGVAAAAERAGPLREIPLGGPGEWLGGEVADAYLAAIVPAALHGAGQHGAGQHGAGQHGADRSGTGPEDQHFPKQAVDRDSGPGPARTGAGQAARGGARHDLRVAYTPMHGVGLSILLRAFERAGFAEPAVVAAQAEPDGAFPTLPKPNPEEPGALDLLMAEGTRRGADLLLANDPDADRLAVGIPDPASPGGWRLLHGDEIGALLGGHLLSREPDPSGRLLVTTVVSAGLLGQMAAAAGADYAETLTGFKWIMRAVGTRPGTRFLFGYEEALGYAVTDLVRDKDGISAALVLADAAAQAKRDGGGLAGRLDDLARRFGLYATGQMSLARPGGEEPARAAPPGSAPAAAGPDGSLLDGVRSAPPATLLGQPVVTVDDLSLGIRSGRDGTKEPLALPRSDVIIWRCADGTRVAVRPSGTEPKVKVYLQVVLDAAGRSDLAPLRAQAARRLASLREEVTEVLDL